MSAGPDRGTADVGAVAVEIAPVGPLGVFGSDDAYHVLVLEVRVNVIWVSTVKTGVRDADHDPFSGVTQSVHRVDVHERFASGGVVKDLRLYFLLHAENVGTEDELVD